MYILENVLPITEAKEILVTLKYKGALKILFATVTGIELGTAG
jgi:hypothetical protein